MTRLADGPDRALARQLELETTGTPRCYIVEPEVEEEAVDTVGVRELKQNASAVVAKIAAGKTLAVTVRGRPVARLSPMASSPLEQLIEDGLARPARTDLAKLSAPAPGPSLSETLRRMRDDERY